VNVGNTKDITVLSLCAAAGGEGVYEID